MDDTIMLVTRIAPVIGFVAFNVWYIFERAKIVSAHEPLARIRPLVRPRPSLLQESFIGFTERTWFVVALAYGSAVLIRWLGGEADIAAGMIQRPPGVGAVYGYIALAYLARDIWRVRKPLGALLTGRGGWAGIKAAHASGYAARSRPKTA